MRVGAGWVAFIGATLAAAAAAPAQTTNSAPGTALPPMSEPPLDVPMHVPQPPRDTAVPAAPQVQAAPATPTIAPPAAPPTSRSPPPAVASRSGGGTITPIAPRCREATYRVIIDGRGELAHARVCRTADGGWRLVP